MYPPPQIDYLHNAQLHSLWPLPTFWTAYLAKLHILPQHRHCEGLLQEINIHFPYSLVCVRVPPPPPTMDYLHKCIVFDHCQLFLQLFPQHTWPEFIFCHNIGIVKVSHTNLTSDIHIPRAVSVFPKNKLTICTITKSLTIANFSTIYLATIHILPQHRHCKELSHKNLKSSFHTPLSVCSPPPPQRNICTIT